MKKKFRTDDQKMELIEEWKASGMPLNRWAKGRKIPTSMLYRFARDKGFKLRKGPSRKTLRYEHALMKPETVVLPPIQESGRVLMFQGSPQFIAALMREM
jgi:hypothetical protein